MTHQINVLRAQKCSCLSRCVRARIVVVKSDSSSAVDFPDFLEDWKELANKWLYTTQNLLFCIVLVVRLRHVQFFCKNRRSFAWKCFVCELQTTAVYFRAHTNKFTIHQMSRCHRSVSKHRNCIFGAFLSTNWHEVFNEWLTNCVESNANKFFFDNQMFMQWMYAGPTKA